MIYLLNCKIIQEYIQVKAVHQVLTLNNNLVNKLKTLNLIKHCKMK